MKVRIAIQGKPDSAQLHELPDMATRTEGRMAARLLVLAVVFWVTPAATRNAQSVPAACAPFETTADVILGKAREYAADQSPNGFRAKRLGIPSVAASEVQFVTDEGICTQALATYTAEVPPDSGTTYSNVYVVRMGTYYLVTESSQQAGEWLRGIMLNSTFQKTSGIFGL